MKKLYENQIGSTWRKWDLHIHSTHSKESTAKLSVKDIFDNAIDNEISVVAITDHSNVNALDEAWQLHESTFLKDGETYYYKDFLDFIPGVELKTDKGNKPIHLIALFPKEIQIGEYTETVNSSYLKSEFLAKIYCSDGDIKRAGNGDYAKGLLEVQVDFEDACEQARKLGGITIVHNGSKSNGFDKGMSHSGRNPSEEEILTTFSSLKEKLMTECVDVCEIPTLNTSNQRDIDFYLDRFNKPFIMCSDSHSEYKGEKYSWIKADPTFDGLKQIIFEPRHRICLGEKPPIDPIYRIDKMSFDFPADSKLDEEEFCLSGRKDLYFSPNLTCIIGGRGSGKSTILNLIHEKLQPSQNRFFTKHNLVLPTDLKISDCVKIDDDSDEKYIEFLSQNEIEEFALDHGKFTKAIFSRLSKLDESNELSKLAQTLKKHLVEIENITKSYESLKVLREKHGNYLKELKTNEKVVSSLEDERYTDITKSIQNIDSEVQKISSSRDKLENFTKDLEQVLKRNRMEGEPNNPYEKHHFQLIEIIKAKLLKINHKDTFESILKLEEALNNELQTTRRKLDGFLEDRGLSNENLKDVSEANQNINRYKHLLKDTDSEIKQTIHDIEEFSYKKELKINYENQINKMLTGLNTILNSLNEHVKTIELKYVFNEEKAKERLLERIKNKFPRNDKFNNLRSNDIKRYLFHIEPNNVITQDEFLEGFEEVGKNTKTYHSLHEYFSDKINFNIYKSLINHVYSDVEEFKMIKVFYDRKPLERTSFGQRCTAAIVVLLLLGNNPIIIDEPEAHLDSSLIADYLVDLIKKNKSNRQIIFATHNANFVVNGDAELIHYLEINENNKTELYHMTIENIAYREKLLRLEGGKRAFEQREKRYQFQ